MAQTDAMIARLEGELEERNAFVEGLIANAQEANQGAGRDLTGPEMEMINAARGRIGIVADQLSPLRDTAKLAIESRARARQINDEIQNARGRGNTGPVEYRTAGAYVADRYLAMLGDHDALQRTEVFNRVAAHQTTADNPGLLPESIVAPLVNFVDFARPLVSTLNPQDLGGGSWSYARVTQHTQVAVQAGEKTELASRKMLITKTPITAPTYGGYVNVSRQDISRTSPAILDMVINDLAGEYAIETEKAAGTTMTTAAQVGPVIPATPTAANVATAIWGAVGSVSAAVRGQGRIVVMMSPDQLGILGPLFPPVNPTNAFSSGFDASTQGAQGAQGMVAGVSIGMSSGLATDTILVYSTAAVRAFEMRYGALQVVEPSVWGVQVGYAGDFQTLVVEPTGIVRVTTA